VSGRTEEYERHIVELLDDRGPKTALALGPAEPPRLGVRPWERGVLADPAMTLRKIRSRSSSTTTSTSARKRPAAVAASAAEDADATEGGARA
jgi:hypothetical protein